MELPETTEDQGNGSYVAQSNARGVKSSGEGSGLDLDALETVARAAVPGPWRGQIITVSYPECDDADLPYVVLDRDGKDVVTIPENYAGPHAQYELNGQFIATFDPPTVLRLIEERREAQTDLDFALAHAEQQETRLREALNREPSDAAITAAVDALVKVSWRWGESCGVDDISSMETEGDSYNEGLRGDMATAKRALLSLIHAAIAKALPQQPRDPQIERGESREDHNVG